MFPRVILALPRVRYIPVPTTGTPPTSLALLGIRPAIFARFACGHFEPVVSHGLFRSAPHFGQGTR